MINSFVLHKIRLTLCWSLPGPFPRHLKIGADYSSIQCDGVGDSDKGRVEALKSSLPSVTCVWDVCVLHTSIHYICTLSPCCWPSWGHRCLQTSLCASPTSLFSVSVATPLFQPAWHCALRQPRSCFAFYLGLSVDFAEWGKHQRVFFFFFFSPAKWKLWVSHCSL